MVFHKLNEINYLHILQTLHRVQFPCLPERVQLAQFIWVANESALAILGGLAGPLLQRRRELSQGLIKSLLLWQADAE